VWKDNGIGIAIAGAGDSEGIETVGPLIQEAIMADYLPSKVRFPDELREIIQNTFIRFFNTSIAVYPRDERPWVDLLIAVGVLNDANNYDVLLKASGTTVRIVEPGGECVGTGMIFGKSLIEKFYSPFLDLDDLFVVACYIVFEAKKWVDGCGGNTDLLIASYKNKKFGFVSSADIKRLEDAFEEFDQRIDRLLAPFSNVNRPDEDFVSDIQQVQERLLEFRHQLFNSKLGVFELMKRLKRKA
jgi:hypothetical protein